MTLRLPVAVALCALSAAAYADREVNVPLGRKLLESQVRLDTLWLPGTGRNQVWIGAGLLRSFDAELSLVRRETGPWRLTGDASFNLSPPITDIAPGISLGIQDFANASPGGRRLYLALTYRYGNEGYLNQDVPTEFTFGLWSNRSSLLFFAARLPLSERLYLFTEDDGQRTAAGVEIRPLRWTRFRVVFEPGATLYSAGISARF